MRPAAQFFHVPLQAADGNFLRGSNHKDPPFLLQLLNLITLMIIIAAAFCKASCKGRILAIGKNPVLFLRDRFAVFLFSGTDYNDLLISLVECPPVGNLTATTAIEAGPSVHIHHRRDVGHGRRSLDRCEDIPALAFFKKYRLPDGAVCSDGNESPGRRKEGLFIKRLYSSVLIENEVHSNRTVGMEQSTAPNIIRVMAVSEIHPRGPSDQTCRIAETCQRTGTGPDRAGKINVVFHQRIQHALIVKSAKSTALQDNAAGSNVRSRVSMWNLADL